MCGIFGFISTKEQNVRGVATRLFRLSESRGMEASGFVRLTQSEAVLFKSPHRGSETAVSPALRSLFDHPIAGYQVFIGHSRLATNGHESDNRNNQPVVRDNVACVHNGIIVNADALWRKFSRLHRKYEVDTEIIPAMFSKHRSSGQNPIEALRRTFDLIQGAASVCLAQLDGDYIILATNTGSLYAGRTKRNTFVFASEEYILRRLGSTGISRMDPNTGLLVSFGGEAVRAFNLKKRRYAQVSSHTISRAFRDVSEYPTSLSYGSRLNNTDVLRRYAPDVRVITAIRRCARCILPETMPLIEFDERGVCNFCRTYLLQRPAGLEALKHHVEPFRSIDGKPDCIVALSGGRDSSYGLHFIKTVLGLNPIAYTYDWGMVTDAARRNQSRLTAALGIEHIIVSANIPKKRENIRKNVLAWLDKPDISMVPLFMAGDKQAEFYAEKLKRKTGIRLIVYSRGNQLEDERFKFGYYGIFDGTPRGVIHNLAWKGRLRMAAYFARACIRNPGYINSSLTDTAFAYASSYLIPHRDFIYLWHYIPWNEKEVVSTIRKKYGWETARDTVATWRIDDGTPPFYNYIYYHVQGFTEHDGLRSNQVREGQISRTEALELATEENKPRYESLAWYFDRIGINGERALSIINSMPTRY